MPNIAPTTSETASRLAKLTNAVVMIFLSVGNVPVF
jgi:hypothetical protein